MLRVVLGGSKITLSYGFSEHKKDGEKDDHGCDNSKLCPTYFGVWHFDYDVAFLRDFGALNGTRKMREEFNPREVR